MSNRKLLRSVIKANVGLRPRRKNERTSSMHKAWQEKKRTVLAKQILDRSKNVTQDIFGAQDLLLGKT